MPIGNIESRHGIEAARNVIDQRPVADNPEAVTDAVVCNKINLGRISRHPRKNFIHGRIGPAGEQHRTRLRIERLDLADPIIFLGRPGELVPANTVGVVCTDRRSCNQAGLDMLSHFQSIHVITGQRVTSEHTGIQHMAEIVGGTAIDLRGIRIGPLREIDFGLGNVQETPWTTVGTHPRLVAVEYIIGRRNHIGRSFADRPQAGKGTDQTHGKTARLYTRTALYTPTRDAAIPEDLHR